MVLPLALRRGYGLLLLYGLGMSAGMGFFGMPLFAVQVGLLEAQPRFRHRRADVMSLREIPLALGRAGACDWVLWAVDGPRSPALGALLVAVALGPLASYLVLRPYLQAGGSGPSCAEGPAPAEA